MTIQLSRRAVAVILAAFLALTAVATTSLVLTLSRTADAGAGFNDTPPWAADQINWLADNGIATGFDDGSFGPNKNITRAQSAFWFGNYNERLTWQNRSSGPAAGTVFTDKIGCPNGGEPIAGGGYASEPNVALTNSQPVDAEWEVRFESISGAAVVPGEVLVWALCRPGNA